LELADASVRDRHAPIRPFSAGSKREPKIKADYGSFVVLIRSHGIMKNSITSSTVLEIFIAMSPIQKAVTF